MGIVLLLTLAAFDGTTVTIPADRHYGIKTLSHGGQPFMEDVGSANSPVAFFGKVDAGGAPFHGDWVLERASLLLDGEPEPFPASLSRGQISQTSLLYGAVRETGVTTISDAGVDEHWSFQGVDPTKSVTTFYAALGTRANRLTDWAAFDAAGTLLAEGTTSNSNAYIYLPAATRSVAQYDPLAGNGMVTNWGFQTTLGTIAFIHDRTYDNKLYLDVRDMWGPANKRFEIDQSFRFFEAPKASWKTTAATAVPEPSTLVLALVGVLLIARPRIKQPGLDGRFHKP